jgi:hypothetical protein
MTDVTVGVPAAAAGVTRAGTASEMAVAIEERTTTDVANLSRPMALLRSRSLVDGDEACTW